MIVVNDNLKNLRLDENLLEKLKTPINHLPDLSHVQEQNQRALDHINRMQQLGREKKEQYDREVLETLKSIESNTVGLNEIVPLIAINVEKQDELLDFLREVLSISASKSQEEAETKWRKLLNRANSLTKDVETIQKLIGFANVVFQMYINLNS